jgi:hypothetical protein
LFAGLLAPHSVGHNEKIGRLHGQSRDIAAAVVSTVVPHGTTARDVIVVLVVIAIIPSDRDNPDSQLKLAGQECE